MRTQNTTPEQMGKMFLTPNRLWLQGRRQGRTYVTQTDLPGRQTIWSQQVFDILHGVDGSHLPLRCPGCREKSARATSSSAYEARSKILMTLSVEVQRRVRTWAPPRVTSLPGRMSGSKGLRGDEWAYARRADGEPPSQRPVTGPPTKPKRVVVSGKPSAVGRSKAPQAALDNPTYVRSVISSSARTCCEPKAREQHKSYGSLGAFSC